METKPNTACPQCGRPMQQDERYVSFACGSSPICTLSVKLRAEWCPCPTCKNTTITVIPNKTGKMP